MLIDEIVQTLGSTSLMMNEMTTNDLMLLLLMQAILLLILENGMFRIMYG